MGSLAEVPVEAGVQNVTVKRVVAARTTDAFQIKSYGRPSNGFVESISLRHAIMRNVDHCSSKENCPKDVRETQHTDRFIFLKTN